MNEGMNLFFLLYLYLIICLLPNEEERDDITRTMDFYRKKKESVCMVYVLAVLFHDRVASENSWAFISFYSG